MHPDRSEARLEDQPHRPLDLDADLGDGEAFVIALSSHDPGVADSNHGVSANIHDMLEPYLTDLDTDIRDGLIELIGQVWHSSLMGWINGRFPVAEVGVKVERAVRLILEPRFSPVGARP